MAMRSLAAKTAVDEKPLSSSRLAAAKPASRVNALACATCELTLYFLQSATNAWRLPRPVDEPLGPAT
jgi:hypothetical protein